MAEGKTGVDVFIMTLNEEANIRPCLEAVKWADNIFVFDSGSTDRTTDIAREYTEKIHTRKFDNYSAHINWALDNLPFENEWLLFVDADEIVTPELAAEVRAVVARSPAEITAFWVKRRFIFLGKWLKHGGQYKTRVIRLFRHRKVRFQRLVNQVPVYEGGDGYLENDLIHDDRKGFRALVARHNSYSTFEAMESLKRLNPELLTEAERAATVEDDTAVKRKKRIFERLPLILRPPTRFIYMYLVSFGFLDGAAGFIYSFFKMCYEFFICVKIYELRRRRRARAQNGETDERESASGVRKGD